MAIDGILIHHLVNELKEKLENGRINKIIQPNQNDLVFQIHNFKTYNLLISISFNYPRVYLINEKPQAPQNPFNLCMVFRKYIERGIVKEIQQIDNDRIILLKIENKNEMGDTVIYNLIIELMGRTSNLILTYPNNQIIEVMRRHFPQDLGTSRIMIPKATYQFPVSNSNINPFEEPNTDISDINNLQGVSKQHKNEIIELGSVYEFINKPINPTIISTETKKFFSPYALISINGSKKSYASINEMLEAYFKENTKQENPDYKNLQKVITQKLNILYNKIQNLEQDLENSKKHLNDLELGQLLQTYLYLIKKGMKEIELTSFDGNSTYLIKLDPLKTPIENMQKYFKSYKKSQNAQIHLKKQLEITNNEITYLQTIQSQLNFVNPQEMEEIKLELIENGYLKENKNKKKIKNSSLKNILTYDTPYGIIYVGKNNLQNNFLTNKFAKKDDYWFHVKDQPSAHIILSTDNLCEENIRICAHLAALNSKYEKSSSVCVDYTMVKNIKKVPGIPGCFVTYSNQRSIYIDPSYDDLNKLLNHQSK